MQLLTLIELVLGAMYFDTKELNPLISDLVATNLPGFVVAKFAVTVCIAVIFVLMEKILLKFLHPGSFF